MGVVPPVTEPSHAVFLSYASEDAQAAQRICEALRAAGIEVWFDQSELRGGDAWDHSIRKQIKTCALFLPIISKHTHERAEGYFRLEWKLAVDRSHLIMVNKAFLVPVVVDDTGDDDENVPEKFREVQWTRLPGGEAPPEFVARIKRLLATEPPITAQLPASAASGSSPIPSTTSRPSPLKRALPVAAAVLILAALAYLLINRPWISRPVAASPAASNATSSPGALPAAFNPPPHSIAVLPFVNMSGDKEQEYFSEGLTEELLNSLSRINELQVAARTSSFSFQGEHPDIATVAHKLNVASVLEGSVRRSGRTVRITAQLNNALTGYHLWSQSYDRDLGDVLKLQTDIATAVAGALKVTLLGDVAARIELGGTRNPAALDAYLKGMNAHFTAHTKNDELAAIGACSDAIRLDPNYALAFAERSLVLTTYAAGYASELPRREALDRAQADARKAIELAPELVESHLALANAFESSLEFGAARHEYERALAFGPGNARLLRDYGRFAIFMGLTDAGLTALRRALVLDPLNRRQHSFLGDALGNLRRYEESNAAYRDALTIDPDDSETYVNIGANYYLQGNFESARSWCEAKRKDPYAWLCLACAYQKLGRRADAETALSNYTAEYDFPYMQAMAYAQWGETAKALELLERAMLVRDPTLEQLKVDPMLDPLRNKPRFQAIERELNFPK